MSIIIVTFVAAALVLTAVGVLGQGSITAINLLTDSWSRRESRVSEIVRTQIQVLATDASTSPYVDVTIKNAGETPILAFTSWDLIVEYYETDGTYHQTWLPYSAAAPGDNQWTVTGLYLDAGAGTPEKFQPNILDPEEELIIRIKLAPALGSGTDNQVVIGTPNGISVSSPF